MDVREKLIGLIAKAKYICANDYSDHTEDEYIADTLLDNGVTVQEWISVKERLPEIGRKCLIANREIVVRGWLRPDGVWKTGVSSDEVWSKFSLHTPTHWMPLPEPPKEETP